MDDSTRHLLRQLQGSIDYENSMEVDCVLARGREYLPAARTAYLAVQAVVQGVQVDDPLGTVQSLMLAAHERPNYGGARWQFMVALVDDWLHEREPARFEQGQLRVAFGLSKTYLQTLPV